jgi:hypothetical protein
MNIILMMRGALTALWSVACLVATPALAITVGKPDGNAHPNVGALCINFPYPDGPIVILCSGTLISKTVFLTAAHCVNFLVERGIPPDGTFVTFDSVFTNVSTTYQGTYQVNPNSGPQGNTIPGQIMSYRNDVAVVVLDKPIDDIIPATLPRAGFLDELKAQKLLKDKQFVTVGYGRLRQDKTKGPESIYPSGGVRSNATGTFSALTDDWLKISMNPSTGDGGTCYGDSGGPHLLNDTVVSITVTGDIPCRATDVTYRLDIESARAYLKQFVTLPE